MKLNKRLKLERHRYAPEMNALVIGKTGQRRVPGAQAIKDARNMLGWVPVRQGIVAHVTKTYPEPFEHLNMRRHGYVRSRAEGMAYARAYISMCVHKEPAVLFDGTTLPVPEVRVTFTLRG